MAAILADGRVLDSIEDLSASDFQDVDIQDLFVAVRNLPRLPGPISLGVLEEHIERARRAHLLSVAAELSASYVLSAHAPRLAQMVAQATRDSHLQKAAAELACDPHDQVAREKVRELTSEITGEWPEPIPLPGLPPVTPLDPRIIPAPLRGWLVDTATRMQIPLDYPAAAAIVALGSIIGRGCGIRPKQLDGWLVIPNLWGAVVGRPSLMKTPAVTEAQKPLARLESEARTEYERAMREFEIDREIAKATKKAVVDELGKAVKAGKSTDAARVKLQALPLAEPTRRRYQTQDGTTEKIGELLIENPRGLLVNRDELIGPLRALDREGRELDRAFYLEAWNGARNFTYDRIGRGTLDIPALCLSLFGAITPGPLSEYVYQAQRGGRGDDGLLQRFQLIVWPDSPQNWVNVDRSPDPDEMSRVWKIYSFLTGEIPGAVLEEGQDVPSLRFSLEGQQVFDAWQKSLELRLRSEHGLSPSMESHLAKYRSLMPALALIFHLVEVADGTTAPGPVSEGAASMAAAWCTYLESHACRVYGGIASPGMESAREILRHITRGAIQDGDSVRSVYRGRQWTRLTTSEEVRAGLEVLEVHGWLVVEKPEAGERGGRPSEKIRLNPKMKRL